MKFNKLLLIPEELAFPLYLLITRFIGNEFSSLGIDSPKLFVPLLNGWLLKVN